MNKFQEIISKRIQALKLELDLVGATEHNATTGFLREKYVTRFLRDMTPPGISLRSGVVFDLNDRVSPQLDLIAAFDEVLPSIVFHDDVSMVPVEAAQWAIEIKSKLEKKKHLEEQLEKQNKWIQETTAMALPGQNYILPTAILALDGAEKESVKKWMKKPEAKNTVMCCVIGQYHLIRQGNEVKEIIADAGHFNETMHFLSDYWGGLLYLREQWRKGQHIWLESNSSGIKFPHPLEAYLKGMRPEEQNPPLDQSNPQSM